MSNPYQCAGKVIAIDPDGKPHEEPCPDRARYTWCVSSKPEGVISLCVKHWGERYEAEVQEEHNRRIKKRLELEKKKRLEQLEKA
jgi:hypothetical protein